MGFPGFSLLSTNQGIHMTICHPGIPMKIGYQGIHMVPYGLGIHIPTTYFRISTLTGIF